MGYTKPKDIDAKIVEEKKVVRPMRPEKPKTETKAIVRVAGTDLDGEKPLIRALKGIKGIGHAMSKAICIAAKLDQKTKLGSLSEMDIEKLEQIIKNPIEFGIPSFLVNRRRDVDVGKDIHLTSSDFDTARKFDIKKTVDIKSYRGWRHMLGQPVRGQRTRSHFREKGRVVGVMRKEIKLQLAKKAEEEKK